MKVLHITIISMICFLFFATQACKKLVNIGTPKNQLTSSGVFADSVNANAAILGIYETAMQLQLGISSGGLSLYPGLSSDELSYTGTDATILQFNNNKLLYDNGTNAAFWANSYKYIYQCNACIEGIAATANISSGAKNKLTAEARFLRAFFYFNLVNLYGPVPIILNTNYENNALRSRIPVNLVYEQIIADVKFAQANLSNNSTAKARANFYSATALLAKVYLYTGQYDLAVTEADKIINSGAYTIVANLANVFLPASSESIWFLVPVAPLRPTWEGYTFVPASATAKPKYTIRTSLYNSFETGDLRKTNWIKVNTVTGVAYPYPYKYKLAIATATNTENSVVFRLAEIYLIRAEAKADLNDIPGSTVDLNVIRNRAGLPVTAATDKSSLLTAIEKEREVELFCEWGNRWFDLKRIGRAGAILGSKTGWTDNAVLYPVPQAELIANPNLTQNQGY